MQSLKKIQAKYLAKHNALGQQKSAEVKELFDDKHREVWADCNVDLQSRKAQLLSNENPTEKEKQELAELEDMFPSP